MLPLIMPGGHCCWAFLARFVPHARCPCSDSFLVSKTIRNGGKPHAPPGRPLLNNWSLYRSPVREKEAVIIRWLSHHRIGNLGGTKYIYFSASDPCVPLFCGDRSPRDEHLGINAANAFSVRPERVEQAGGLAKRFQQGCGALCHLKAALFLPAWHSPLHSYDGVERAAKAKNQLCYTSKERSTASP